MAPRAVRVVTEVAAVDRPFDYELDPSTGPVGLGDRVRVDFNHRSVRGWVVEEVAPSDGLKTVKKWLGFGPPASMLELLRWASVRWYGTWSRFLHAASPPKLVTSLPTPPAAAPLAAPTRASAWSLEPGVIQLGPTTDPLGLVLEAYEATRARTGSLLVLVPTEGWARRLRGRLEQRGCAVAGADEWDRLRAGWPVAVGARGTALAPLSRLAGAVVLDADDESYVSSAAPTWNALEVVRERCRRDEAPLWCTSIMPSPVLLGGGGYVKGDDLVGSWPRAEVVDLRHGDPHDGVLSPVALAAARHALDGDEPVAVVVLHQRLGAGRLLACARCAELARCAVCQQAEAEVGDGLACAERHDPRARFCRHCGSTNLRRLRVGVTTLARDVSVQLGRAVSEITAAGPRGSSLERVVVGTEAIWQHVRRSSVVIFVDFDQYLLAPRSSARRSAVHAVGKAGRLVGSRRDARGAVVLQTRRSEDAVVRGLVEVRFDDLIDEDVATAEVLGLPPFGATAEVSGEGAAAFVAQLTSLHVSETPTGYEIRASDATTLSNALQRVVRPAQKVRVGVS